jgi:AraC-like DNA-binding protein
MLHGPLLFLYIRALSGSKERPDIKDFLHFIPFAIFVIYLVTMSILYGDTAGIHLEHTHSAHQPVIFIIFLIWIALSGPVYFLWSVRLFRKHTSILRSNFSYNERISVGWLKTLVVIFGIVWTVHMGIAITWHILGYFDRQFCTHGITLSISVFIILTGYFGLRQKDIFSHATPGQVEVHNDHTEADHSEKSIVKKYATTGLKEDSAGEYAELLRNFMHDNKPYLEPDLTLSGLSEKLNIPGHHLSQVINERFGLNFYDFINRYRVDEAKQRIADPKYAGLSLLGIALDSGFNSKSAFNRLFKKFTGMTPSEYKANPESV